MKRKYIRHWNISVLLTKIKIKLMNNKQAHIDVT